MAAAFAFPPKAPRRSTLQLGRGGFKLSGRCKPLENQGVARIYSPPMAKLKTFTTEQGFFELAVAAPSRAAALKAWGMKHDLFAQGLAWQSQDKAAIVAAEAQPGEVLRRPLGSKGAFGIESVLPKVKTVPGRTRKKRQPDRRREAKKAAESFKKEEAAHRDQLAALQEELRGVRIRIREVSRAWKDRQKQFKALRPKGRR